MKLQDQEAQDWYDYVEKNDTFSSVLLPAVILQPKGKGSLDLARRSTLCNGKYTGVLGRYCCGGRKLQMLE